MLDDMADWLLDHPVVAVLLAGAVIWAALTGIIWWLVPVALAIGQISLAQAAALAFLSMLGIGVGIVAIKD